MTPRIPPILRSKQSDSVNSPRTSGLSSPGVGSPRLGQNSPRDANGRKPPIPTRRGLRQSSSKVRFCLEMGVEAHALHSCSLFRRHHDLVCRLPLGCAVIELKRCQTQRNQSQLCFLRLYCFDVETSSKYRRCGQHLWSACTCDRYRRTLIPFMLRCCTSRCDSS